MKKLLYLTLCGVAILAALSVSSAVPSAFATVLTGHERMPVDGGTAWIKADEYGSSAPFDITNTDGKADFTVTKSQIDQTAVGAYPDIYIGCSYGGYCTSNNPFPIQASAIQPGQITTSVHMSEPASGDRWCGFYDNFFNTKAQPTIWGRAGGLELEIWLAALNRNPPAIGLVAKGLNIDGRAYDLYKQPSYPTIAFVPENLPSSGMQTFSGDYYPFVKQAIKYGFLKPSWYAIVMQAGFEVNRGGLGLGISGFTAFNRGG